MVSLDETFTVVGMKNVLKKLAKNQTSSAVGDYVQYLPEIEALVQTEPAAAATFAALTPGYQKSGRGMYLVQSERRHGKAAN